MYTYVNAFVKPRGRQSRWQEADLSGVQLFSLWEDYSRVYLVLSNPVLPDDVALDIEVGRQAIVRADPKLTVTQWLTGLGNASLPTEPVPELKTQYVRTADLYYAGYSVRPVGRTAHPDALLPRKDKRDLLLTKPELDYQRFFDYALVTVNGFVHRPEFTDHGIQIVDGAQSGWLSNQTQAGIVSFEGVGKIQTVAFDPSWIYTTGPDLTLGQVTHVHIPLDLSGKTVLVVMGGYLHVLTDFFKEVGEGTYRLDFNNYPMLERFYESRGYLDLTSIEAHLTLKNGTYDQLALEELYSDAAIRALLSLPQTFLVIVDTPELFVQYDVLEPLPTPGRYVSRETPVYPLTMGYGRLPEYWPMPEEDRWVLQIHENLKPEYNFNTVSWWNELSVNNHRGTLEPYRYAAGAFLKIGRDL